MPNFSKGHNSKILIDFVEKFFFQLPTGSPFILMVYRRSGRTILLHALQCYSIHMMLFNKVYHFNTTTNALKLWHLKTATAMSQKQSISYYSIWYKGHTWNHHQCRSWSELLILVCTICSVISVPTLRAPTAAYMKQQAYLYSSVFGAVQCLPDVSEQHQHTLHQCCSDPPRDYLW